MNKPPGPDNLLFDEPALQRNLSRARAQGQLPSFLDDITARDLADNFSTIARRFHKIAVIAHDQSILLEAINQSQSSTAAVTSLSPISTGGLFLNAPGLTPESFDCIFVCGGLEWVNDLPGCLVQLRQALVPDGVLLAGMLGGETFTELRQSWLHADTEISNGVSPRVAPFCDVRDAGSLLQRAGFALPVVDTDRLSVRYDNALALMTELKSVGLANAIAQRRHSLTTPAALAAACAHYDTTWQDDDGRVRATIQIIYLTGWAPDASQQQPLKPGSARTRLADALKVHERKLPRN